MARSRIFRLFPKADGWYNWRRFETTGKHSTVCPTTGNYTMRLMRVSSLHCAANARGVLALNWSFLYGTSHPVPQPILTPSMQQPKNSFRASISRTRPSTTQAHSSAPATSKREMNCHSTVLSIRWRFRLAPTKT